MDGRLLAYYRSTDPRHTLVGALRAVVRCVRFGLAFVLLSALTVASRALRSPRAHQRTGPALRRLIGRTLCRAAGLRIPGFRRLRASLPAEVSLFVCNHISWIDSFVLAAVLGTRFVVAETWRDVPVLGTILRAGGNLFIDRRRLSDLKRVGRRLTPLLAGGDRTTVFPEAGTGWGDRLRPFHAALLEPAAVGELPVGWLALRYELPPGWPPTGVVMGWEDWTPIWLKIFRDLHPRWVRARLVVGREPVVARNRRELAAVLRDRISHHLVPLEIYPPAEMARITCPRSRWYRRG
jgi:1-acyl-sn-glycerol-3-phosphate acyltransferase